MTEKLGYIQGRREMYKCDWRKCGWSYAVVEVCGRRKFLGFIPHWATLHVMQGLWHRSKFSEGTPNDIQAKYKDSVEWYEDHLDAWDKGLTVSGPKLIQREHQTKEKDYELQQHSKPDQLDPQARIARVPR